MNTSFEHWKPGERIRGKWHGHAYELVRKLGEGANGTVWKVCREGRMFALKIGMNEWDMLCETDALRSVNEARGFALGPKLYETDDWVSGDRSYMFYVMSLVTGSPLHRCARMRQPEWRWVFLLQCLRQLSVLHRKGWVFGDWKPEHILIRKGADEIRLIDFGGVTPIGRHVRQYTEMYDRAAWGMGDRKADPAYDLFALAVLFLSLHVESERWMKICKQSRHRLALYDIIRRNPNIFPYRRIFIRMIRGELTDAGETRRMLLRELLGSVKDGSWRTGRLSVQKRSLPYWEGAFVSSLFLFLFAMYLLQ